MAKLVPYAGAYYRDFVAPTKAFRAATETESAALADLAAELKALPAEADAEAFQTLVFEIGKRHGFTELREWFKALYEVLLGQPQGPRMGSFIALYGRDNSVALIEKALRGELLAA
ncbi:hypothetical protein [Elstera litoralis]|uniref:hypothetical protein n=1 Tax=Elstera litoralis TaxID=552518 RepID=UPI0006961FAC